MMESGAQRDRLLGCSLTGWQDMVNATGMNREGQIALLEKLREAAHEAAKKLARKLNQKEPLLVTTVKPRERFPCCPLFPAGSIIPMRLIISAGSVSQPRILSVRSAKSLDIRYFRKSGRMRTTAGPRWWNSL